MKKLFQLLGCAVLAMAASSCSQGSAAIDKAYEEACQAAPAEKVATTLTNGHIKCSTLTSDEAAKLGAVLGYITYTGLYSSNFEAQVDMHEFGELLDGYRSLETRQTGEDRALVEQYTREILVNLPAPPAPEGQPCPGICPNSPAPEGQPCPGICPNSAAPDGQPCPEICPDAPVSQTPEK